MPRHHLRLMVHFSDPGPLLKASFHKPIRSFVRREGRLTPAQERAIDELLPRYRIDPGAGHLRLNEIFGNTQPVVMEIGFGNGSLLAEQSASHPEYNFIGIEVHRPGIGRLLQQLDRQGSQNVRISDRDAIELLEDNIPENSLDAIWLYFPDPWPKKRHHKRRIVNSHFLDLAARTLKRHGLLHMATDWQEYAEHMRAEISTHTRFSLVASPDRKYYPFARPSTHFEQRGRRKGHQVSDLYAVLT